MALNFTVSYTFSPSTTISSSQVNTNTNDVAAVFQGVEAGTKTFSQIKIDSDPTTALQVPTKQYVDHYSTWRRPNLQYASITTVAIESGLDGTSGDIPMLFPDGSVRTETSTTRTTFNITRNAVLVTSGAQSGLTGATSEASNTWYALYACKITDSSTQWVTVGSTVLPLQANFSTLNTAYGTSGWVYLGMIRNGDNSGTAADILAFYQSGNSTLFYNNALGTVQNANGIRLATSAGATALGWTYAAGTGAAQIPDPLRLLVLTGVAGAGSGRTDIKDVGNTWTYYSGNGTTAAAFRCFVPYSEGLRVANSSSVGMDIFINGYVDGVLGVGSNPLL